MNRMRFNIKINWPEIFRFIRTSVFFIAVIFATITVVSLLSFDTVIGAFFWQNRIPGEDLWQGLFISSSTTGLTIGLVVFYMITKEALKKDKIDPLIMAAIENLGVWAYYASWFAWIIDVYLDSPSSDYLVYKSLVSIVNMWNTGSHTDAVIHVVTRLLIGILSMVGEPLALAILAGFGVIADKLSNVATSIAENQRPVQKPATQSTPPSTARQTTQPVVRYSQPSTADVRTASPSLHTATQLRSAQPKPVVRSSQQTTYPTLHKVSSQSAVVPYASAERPFDIEEDDL